MGRSVRATAHQRKDKKMNLEFKVTPYRLVNQTSRRVVIRRKNEQMKRDGQWKQGKKGEIAVHQPRQRSKKSR